MAAPKVYWTDPQHDEKVKTLIEQAMGACANVYDLYDCGIGVIDFADCTVVVITRAVPQGEVFVHSRMDENSILHGGFGIDPFAGSSIDIGAELGHEVRNPDAKTLSIGVNGLKK